MDSYLLGFPNKKERDDFLIALVVILFFLSLFWFFTGSPDGPKMSANIIPVAKVIENDTDSDADGIVDSKDKCPNLYGVVANNGCPADTDKDGIYDRKDKCPNLAGVRSNDGCPADTDKDGVYDKDDRCPKIPGKTKSGCPPDTDGDGVFDSEDECPKVKGTKENNGCPFSPAEVVLIRNIEESLEFETGKSVLTKTSEEKLDQLTKLLRKYSDMKMSIEGHTDSIGDDAKNLELSRNRAAACKTYLVERGVLSSRLKTTGFGETRPRATNTTREGQAKNRRVMFKSF